MSVIPGVRSKCKICGKDEFIRQADREVCKHCGTAYVAYDTGLATELRTADAMRESAGSEEAGLCRRTDASPEAIPLTPEQEAMLWVPGSGIGYSTHDYSESLYTAYRAFEDLAKIEGGTPSDFHLAEKREIAEDEKRAKQLLDMYDLERLLGTGVLSAMRYKKYNKKYIESLKEKFWS